MLQSDSVGDTADACRLESLRSKLGKRRIQDCRSGFLRALLFRALEFWWAPALPGLGLLGIRTSHHACSWVWFRQW